MQHFYEPKLTKHVENAEHVLDMFVASCRLLLTFLKCIYHFESETGDQGKHLLLL